MFAEMITPPPFSFDGDEPFEINFCLEDIFKRSEAVQLCREQLERFATGFRGGSKVKKIFFQVD